MLKNIAEKILPIHVEKLRILGIDEISLVKGQGKFIVVLVDLETHKLIALVSERKQSQIEKVMRTWGEKVLSQIEEVSMDMTGNYKSLVKKLCPNAEVTLDRFHVIKMIHEELNQARIEQKTAAKSLNAKDRNDVREAALAAFDERENMRVNSDTLPLDYKFSVESFKSVTYVIREFVRSDCQVHGAMLSDEDCDRVIAEVQELAQHGNFAHYGVYWIANRLAGSICIHPQLQ